MVKVSYIDRDLVSPKFKKSRKIQKEEAMATNSQFGCIYWQAGKGENDPGPNSS